MVKTAELTVELARVVVDKLVPKLAFARVATNAVRAGLVLRTTVVYVIETLVHVIARDSCNDINKTNIKRL